jgi:hypothetical protein
MVLSFLGVGGLAPRGFGRWARALHRWIARKGTAAQVTQRRKTSPTSVLNDRGWKLAPAGLGPPAGFRGIRWGVANSDLGSRAGASFRKRMGKNGVQSRKPRVLAKNPLPGRKWASAGRTRCVESGGATSVRPRPVRNSSARMAHRADCPKLNARGQRRAAG